MRDRREIEQELKALDQKEKDLDTLIDRNAHQLAAKKTEKIVEGMRKEVEKAEKEREESQSELIKALQMMMYLGIGLALASEDIWRDLFMIFKELREILVPNLHPFVGLLLIMVLFVIPVGYLILCFYTDCIPKSVRLAMSVSGTIILYCQVIIKVLFPEWNLIIVAFALTGITWFFYDVHDNYGKGG